MDVKKERRSKAFMVFAKSLITSPRAAPLLCLPLKFLGGFIISRAVVFGNSAPFGLSFCAVSSALPSAVASLLGASFGYLSLLDDINSLKYIACAILIFTARFVFGETSLSKHRLFAPLSVLIPFLCIDFVFVLDSGFALHDTAVSAFEIAAATVFAAFTFPAENALTHPKSLALSFFSYAAVFSVAVFGLTLPGGFSAGRAFAFLFILLTSACGGAGASALISGVFGIALSLAASSPEPCIIYVIFGIFSSLGIGKGKLCAAVTGGLSALFVSVCLNPASLFPMLSELLLSSFLFFPLAGIFPRFAHRFFIREKAGRDSHIRLYASERLRIAANAFGTLGTLISETRRRNPKESTVDIPALFNRASKELCRDCKLCSICWERDYEATRDALNNAGESIRKNGTLRSKDFPMYFSSRCLHIEDFINSINREIFSIRYRRLYEGKLRESHELLTKQYAEVAEIFSSVSSDIADAARFDEEAENSLRDILASFGILCETAVYRDSRGHKNIHLCGKDLNPVIENSEKFLVHFSLATETQLSPPIISHTEILDDIVIREKPPLRALFGAATKKRGDSDMSGDSGSFFHPANGICALLLSDGMGSGKLAACESATSIRLLEDLLRSDIPPARALQTLHTAFSLKTEYSGSFATLDLAYIDLFSGVCDIFKFGGAPTYIKRGEKLRRISTSSLPAGMSIGSASEPDKTTLTLLPGDYLIMTSDGICDGDEESGFPEFLSKTEAESPKMLADAIAAFSLATCGKNDDMTVAVIEISENE